MTTHHYCDHENSKAARALCRRERPVSNAEMVVTRAFVFVRQARAQGFSNLLSTLTLEESAQELGVGGKYNLVTAIAMVKERATLMGEWGIIADDIQR